MLDFLANNIEQLALARDHISAGDANNARFGLMLTDNVVEITLHQTALDAKMLEEVGSSSWLHREPYEHAKTLGDAVGRYFSPKVRFARASGKLDEEAARTIKVAHKFRNDVYHLGLQHESVLPVVSRFYFVVACGFLADYRPNFYGYTVGKELPARAKAYFGDGPHYSNSRRRTAEAASRLRINWRSSRKRWQRVSQTTWMTSYGGRT